MMIVYSPQIDPGGAGTITLDGALKDANDLNAVVTIYCSAMKEIHLQLLEQTQYIYRTNYRCELMMIAIYFGDPGSATKWLVSTI